MANVRVFVSGGALNHRRFRSEAEIKLPLNIDCFADLSLDVKLN